MDSKNIPLKKPGADEAIEKLQRDYLNGIPAIRELNYWDLLKTLKMLSLQRRLEKYRIVYIWKMLEGISQNYVIEVKLKEEELEGNAVFQKFKPNLKSG